MKQNKQIIIDKDLAARTENILGTHAIANSANKKDLQEAVERTVAAYTDFAENQTYDELQSLAKELHKADSSPSASKEYIDKFQEAIDMNSVANGQFLKDSVHSKHRKMAIHLRSKLITELDIKSITELMILDTVISAYFRSLHLTKLYSYLIQDNEGYIHHEEHVTNTLKELNKSIEMANRQFTTSLTFLKELKQPPINIKVNSKQAFVSQNQQINKNA